ncbi:MAG: hypothetical protein ACPLY7_02610, partial [Microgenomates group bacterium]
MIDQSLPFSLIEIRVPRTSEKTPEAAAQLFASFLSLPRKPLFSFKPPVCLSFEIASVDQIIHFLVACPKDMTAFVESQISAQYPESVLTILPRDYLAENLQSFTPFAGQLQLSWPFYLPLRTFRDLKETDLLASPLGIMSKARPQDFMAIQILLAQAGNWQDYGQSLIDKGVPQKEGKFSPHPQSQKIAKKIASAGFWTGIRLISNSKENLRSLANSFSSYQSEVNSLKFKEPLSFRKQKFIESILKRSFEFVPRNQILNLDELASIWHPPSLSLAGIKNIAWGKTSQSEPPLNLPTAIDTDEADKKQINFIARTEHKNRLTTFGIKKEDRRQHI